MRGKVEFLKVITSVRARLAAKTKAKNLFNEGCYVVRIPSMFFIVKLLFYVVV